MALFMVRSHVKPEARNVIYKRYTDAPSAGEGITQHGDWVTVHGDGAFHLMEADDPKSLADELMKYTDLCTYTVESVIPAADFFELVRKHKLA